MRTIGKLCRALCLLLGAAVPGFAAIPESGIEVRLVDRQPYVDPYSAIVDLQFHLAHGSLHQLGWGLPAEDLFLHGQSARIGKKIHGCSRNFNEMHIVLGVCSPAETEFSTVEAQITRLKRLAAENADEKCNVVILVYPAFCEMERSKATGPPDADEHARWTFIVPVDQAAAEE